MNKCSYLGWNEKNKVISTKSDILSALSDSFFNKKNDNILQAIKPNTESKTHFV